MLTADSADKKNTFRVAFLTAASIFVMGYLNALALNTYDLASMITPQTGNVIWMGIFLVSGYWAYFIETLGLFFGFMGGAVFALFTQNLFRNKTNQFFWNWSSFVLPIIIYPIFLKYVVPAPISFAILGFAAGATLGFFRKMYHMEINTSMATGNVRFLGLHFAQAFLKKDTRGEKTEVKTFWIFFIAVFAFMFGAVLYSVLARVDAGITPYINLSIGFVEGATERLTLGMSEIRYGRYGMYLPPVGSTNVFRVVGLIVICLIPFLFCPKYKKES
jgi:uncharacterized membrane protein YoaK (UPF0700 family)